MNHVHDGMLFCARTEGLALSFTAKPWPVKRLYWTVVTAGFNGTNITKAQVVEAFKAAWDDWSGLLDIEPVYTTNLNQCHVVSRFGAIDGASGVLAWSELADGTLVQKKQQYDTGEAWGWDKVPTNRIDLQRVACHEIGHVIGLVHDNDNAAALMAPYYSRSIRSPMDRDYQRAILLGYKAKPIVPPADEPLPPPTDEPKPKPTPGGVFVDKETLKMIVNWVFDSLKAKFAGKVVLLWMIGVAHQMALSWIDSLSVMAGVEELNAGRIRQIVTFIFALLRGMGAASTTWQTAVDELEATALADTDNLVAHLRAQNLTIAD